jgi:putative redox protein
MNAPDVKAIIHSAGNEMLVGISPSGHAQVIDTNQERNRAATPLELLMIALGSCTAADVIEILRKKRQDVIDYRVEVSGERRDEHPRAFTKLFVHHIIGGRNISSEAVSQAIKLSDEKYCSVAATVKPTVEVITSFEIIEEDVQS